MKVALITVAGISSRFNEGIPEGQKALKAIYSERDGEPTLLSHLAGQCAYADRIVIVGGYRFDDLKAYARDALDTADLRDKIVLVYNERYANLASGYSLYKGLAEVFGWKTPVSEVLFVEGDLDIDDASFRKVTEADSSVLTWQREPITANKSVVLYQDGQGRYRYAFNSAHGLLKIEDSFSAVWNSGQLWKFRNMDALRDSMEAFLISNPGDTNLGIIQEYLDRTEPESVRLIDLRRWVNCNTRADYQAIRKNWEEL